MRKVQQTNGSVLKTVLVLVVMVALLASVFPLENAWAGSAPARPVIIAPLSTTVATRPVFKWVGSTDVHHYLLSVYNLGYARFYIKNLAVATSACAGTPLVCQVKANVNLPNGQYRFSVAAINAFGSSGYGSSDSWTVFTQENPVAAASQVSLGSNHACALTLAGGLKCWGDNTFGQIGAGVFSARLTPISVKGLESGVLQVSAGTNHTCAVTRSGGVKCWGYNNKGQLGDGSTSNRAAPVNVSGLGSGVRAIAAGKGHTCALTQAGLVKCWGANQLGQLGTGSTTNSLVPQKVTGLEGVISITAGSNFTCALTSSNQVKCWGSNSYNTLGGAPGGHSSLPVQISGLIGSLAAISAGYAHACALTNSGQAWCWGNNAYGALADGTNAPKRATPVQVLGFSGDISSFAAGNQHNCVVTSSGTVKCWGWNWAGQVGDGTSIDRGVPMPVSGMTSGLQGVAARDGFSCAINAIGGVMCWGSNYAGQLGGTAGVPRLEPVYVMGFGR